MRYQYGCLFILGLMFSLTGFAQSKAGKAEFILIDQPMLTHYKSLYQQKDTSVTKQIDDLVSAADSILKKGDYSVTFNKTELAPSHNIHDYVSQAPYWWPDSSKTDGKPYIRKDGRRNPEIYLLHDDSQMGKMCSSVRQLTLAYYFTGNEKYVQKAGQLLTVWFITPATRMNPNLDYAQYIPGICDGRGIGIIETAALTNIPDMMVILQSSKNTSAGMVTGVKKWYGEYLKWLQTSENGRSEHSQINNHGTYYDLQVVNYALFTGKKTVAINTLLHSTFPRIDQQFTTDGAQPLELIRTKSWSYANMNLWAWCRLAVMAAELNIDLWHQQTLDGKGIQTAINWMMPYALKTKPWRFEQIEPFGYGTLKQIVHTAAAAYPPLSFDQFLKEYPLKNQLQNIN
jgi:hypothetical protein